MKRGISFQLGAVLSAWWLLMGSASATSQFRASDDLGKTMFIGDSITHGSRDANISWRWWMHRLLVDNGISYEAVGVVRGGHIMRQLHSTLFLDAVYGDTIFHNWHAAYSGARSTDIVGKRASGKFRNTSLAQWLGRRPCTSDEVVPVDGSKISTYFVLIGTNDAITADDPYHRSDWDAAKVNSIATEIKENLQIILTEIRSCNPAARVVFIEIPTWYQWHDAKYVANHVPGVREINRQLREWASVQGEGVTMVGVDDGLTDVASDIKGRGVKSMYAETNANGLHPNDQGALLIAGNVAKALGYAGATAGQVRRDSKAFECDIRSIRGSADPVVLNPGGAISGKWLHAPTGEFSLTFTIQGGVGNGAADGWDTRGAFCVSVGNGREAGVLHINEAYIRWNDKVLYSLDTSAGLPGELRIAYVKGEPDRGLKSGFYVWLRDQLIGEGLPSTDTTNGVSFFNGTQSPVTVSAIYMDSTGAYAPASDGVRGK